MVAAVAVFAGLGLHAYPLWRPWLFDDDFGILAGSRAWASTLANLWRPWNDHAMPLGRLSTWALMQLSGRAVWLPLTAALQGPLAMIAGMGLLYAFVRRELGHPFYGLVAMILFGVSLKYNEAVRWFAASFAVLSMDTMLLALLAAQHGQRTGRGRDLALSALAAALAPAWFSLGLLAGPACSLYLLTRPGQAPSVYTLPLDRRAAWRQIAAALVPLIGTLAYFAVAIPLSGAGVQHAAHYAGRTALQVCDPVAGLELTGRTLVDNLLLGLHAMGRTCPRRLVPLVLLPLVGAAYLWWRQPRAQPRLLVLGLWLIICSYWLVYSFRWPWPYEDMMVGWTRYNLLPYLGLVLFVCGGLPARAGTLFVLDPGGCLTRRQAWALGGLAGLMFLLQFPPSLLGHLRTDRDPGPQRAALCQVDEVQARCQAHGISAEAACAALPRLDIPYSGDPIPGINGWELLKGSDQPRPLTADEVRRLLGVPDGSLSAGR